MESFLPGDIISHSLNLGGNEAHSPRILGFPPLQFPGAHIPSLGAKILNRPGKRKRENTGKQIHTTDVYPNHIQSE